MELITKRLRLRLWRDEDLPAFVPCFEPRINTNGHECRAAIRVYSRPFVVKKTVPQMPWSMQFEETS
ncbi:MAG: hypothetical protein WB696_31170, partial [Chthoniobacterales bacterium]